MAPSLRSSSSAFSRWQMAAHCSGVFFLKTELMSAPPGRRLRVREQARAGRGEEGINASRGWAGGGGGQAGVRQRRRAPDALDGARTLKQARDAFDVPTLRRAMEGGCAVGAAQVDLVAAEKQQIDDAVVAMVCGNVQGRFALKVARVHIGAAIEERLGGRPPSCSRLHTHRTRRAVGLAHDPSRWRSCALARRRGWGEVGWQEWARPAHSTAAQ